jgi:general secretion pathway protein A
MEVLYRQYFGLKEAPFNISPDPDFLYLSASHREALAQLSYGINGRKGFIVLTGEVGTGKTTLLRALLNELGSNTHTALIFNTVVNPRDLMRYICEDFAIAEVGQPEAGIHDYVVALNEFLLDKYRRGENCALIIDEAQNLSPEVLESVRLLSNFETSKDKLLQILLIGQPELAERLNSSELRQLKQRVTLRYRLRNLTLNESGEYIGNRLKIAGGDPGVFTFKAVEAIYAYSGGVPRVINVLCDNGLLTAFALGRKVVDTSIVREVAEDLNLANRALPLSALRHQKSDVQSSLQLDLYALGNGKVNGGAKWLRPARKTLLSRLASMFRSPSSEGNRP